MLTEDERQRYSRQIELRGFGLDGQENLKRAEILIAGAGGLGCAAAIYLVVAGIGKLRIVDFDRVSLDNLNRQFLYSNKDIGKKKVDVIKKKLQSINPFVTIEVIEAKIKEDNVYRLVAGCTIIVDALDNLPTRLLLNKAAIRFKIPLIHGGIYGFEGRLTTVIPGKTPCLKCLYQKASPPRKTPVIGVIPGIIGCLQANEVIKYVLRVGKLLAGRLLIYDGLSSEFVEVQVSRSPGCLECHKFES